MEDESSLGITEKDIVAIANKNFYQNDRSPERMQQNRSTKNLNFTNINERINSHQVKKHPKINSNICSTSPTNRKLNAEHKSPKNSDAH